MTDHHLSRLERLKASIGSENMPPKLQQYSPTSTDRPSTSELPTIDQHLASNPPAKPSSSSASSDRKHHNHLQAPRQPVMEPSDTSFDPRCGEAAPRCTCFVPFIAITKFCYTYVRREFQQDVATALFDAGKIWLRTWDLYFIWSDHCPTGGPMVFITENQLQALLDDINKAVPGAKVWNTQKLGEKYDGLVNNFDDFPECLRPRYLAQSISKDQYLHLLANLDSSYATNEVATGSYNVGRYDQMLSAAHQVNRGKGKSKHSGRGGGSSQPTFTSNHGTGDIQRAQRFLGFAGEATIEASMCKLSLSTFSSNNPPPFPFDQDVIIIAFDCEAHERNANAITEVGIATLDTRDLHNVAPGKAGENWQAKIRARHFRVEEYKSHTNSDFVHGCPTKFEFGKSEFVSTRDLPSVLTSCFKPPYSSPDSKGVTSGEEEEEERDQPPRNLILMGHDVTQDIYYVRSIGFDPMNRGNISKIPLDTAELLRTYKQAPNKTSLGNALQEFDLFGWNLHNAGNDAVYTMWAFLAICVAQTAKEHGGDMAGEGDDGMTKDVVASCEAQKTHEQRTMSPDGGVMLPKE